MHTILRVFIFMTAIGSLIILDIGTNMGAVGMFPNGAIAINPSSVFNKNAVRCDQCCEKNFVFTDFGFIAGGQNGFKRTYKDPADVPASPWSIMNKTNSNLSLRIDYENDLNCSNFNPFQQNATFIIIFPVFVDTTVTFNWSGLVGIGDSMQIKLDKIPIILSGSSDQSTECTLRPPVNNVPPPVQNPLTMGFHKILIRAVTGDANDHTGAFFQYNISFSPPFGS